MQKIILEHVKLSSSQWRKTKYEKSQIFFSSATRCSGWLQNVNINMAKLYYYKVVYSHVHVYVVELLCALICNLIIIMNHFSLASPGNGMRVDMILL